MIASADIERFREVIGEAPELSEPCKVGGEQLPYSVCKVDEKTGTGVLETIPRSLGRFTRVEYDRVYGLKAQKFLSLRHVRDDEPVLDHGQVRYNRDYVDIVLAVNYNSSLLFPEIAKELLSDPNNFQVHIGVFPKGEYQRPPLVNVCYGYSPRIPINAEFLYADYQDALKGNVEKLDQGGGATPRYHYRATYFQWENLVGAKVGVQRFEEGVHYPRSYNRVTKINNPTAVALKETPYKEKITHCEGRMSWGEGRLRFSRMNSETGESWFFSVPEWMNTRDFIRDVQDSRLTDFATEYPVVFCVKNPGEPRQWFSTAFRRDRGR